MTTEAGDRGTSASERLALTCAAAAARLAALVTDPAQLQRWLPGWSAPLPQPPAPSAPDRLGWTFTRAGDPGRIHLALETLEDDSCRVCATIEFDTDDEEALETQRRTAGAHWRWRLEALRTLAETGAALEEVAAQLGIAARALPAGAIEREEVYRCHPQQLYAALGALLASGDEIVLSAVPGRRVVSLRLPGGGAAAPGAVTRLVRTIERHGACARLRVVQQGFSAAEPWWDEEQRLRWIPALALSAREEEQRLAQQCARLHEQLDDGAVVIELRVAASAAEVERALSDPRAVTAWLPGWHTGGAQPGDRFCWRAFADEPPERPDLAERLQWPGLEGRWLERHGADERRAWSRVARLERDATPTALGATEALVSIEARGGEGGAPTTLELVWTSAGDQQAERSAARALWRARLEALRDALEGRLQLRCHVLAAQEDLYRTVAEPLGQQLWLDRGASPRAGGAVFTYPAFGEGAQRPLEAPVLERTPPERLRLHWPAAGGPDQLPPPELRFLCTTEPEQRERTSTLRLELEPIARGAPDRLAAVATERARWRWRLLGARSAAENALGWIDERAFDPATAIGPATIRLEIDLDASPAQLWQLLLEQEAPVFEPAYWHERPPAIERVPSGSWAADGVGGQILRLLPEAELEYTFAAESSPFAPTVVRWRLLPLEDPTRCRLQLEERGFFPDPASENWRAHRARVHRFALIELMLRLGGSSLLLPGVVREVAGVEIGAERTVPAAPERVRALWTEPQGLVRWLAARAQIEARAGGMLRLEGGHGPLPALVAGRVLAVRDDHLAWVFPSAIDGSPQWLRVWFEPHEGGCRVRVRHMGFATERPAVREEHARWAAQDSGWPALLARLAQAAAPGDVASSDPSAGH